MSPRFTASRALYRLCLRALPASFRRRFGADMEEDFADLMASSTASEPIAGRVRGWRLAVADLARTSSRERGRATIASIRLDLHDVTRRLRRAPLFTIAVIATLGIGLAVATLTFAIVDNVWLRPFPYAAPDRLVTVSQYGLTSAEFAGLTGEHEMFAALGGYNSGYPPLTLQGDEPLMLQQALVTPNFLEVLGVRPALGQPRFDEPGGGDPEILISHRVWTQRFGGDPEIVGRRVNFEDGTRQVVGVLAPDFLFPISITSLLPDVLTVLDVSQSRNDHWIKGIGRLQPGGTTTRASAVVDRATVAEAPAKALRPTDPSVRSLQDATVGDYVRNMMVLLLGGVILLLLIASLNLTHLLVARAMSRAREVAVRRALGARRINLVRASLLEAFLLAAAGGGVGWGLSLWAFESVRALVPSALPRGASVNLDVRILGGCVAFTLAVGAVSGLFPAIRLSRPGAVESLQRDSRGGSERTRLGKTLIAIEAALAVLLLASGSLMLNSFVRLARVDLGFRPDNTLQVHVRTPSAMTDTQGHEYIERLRSGLGSLPFVAGVAISDMQPIYRGTRGDDLHGEGSPREKVGVDWRTVSPGYFQAIGIRVIDGREFSTADRTAALEPAVLSESVARKLWPDGRAIGRRFRSTALALQCEVIGVVADVRSFAVRSSPTAMVYFSTDRQRATNLYVSVRVAGPQRVDEVTGPIVKQVRAVDSHAAIPDVRTLDDLVSDSLADTRMEAALLGVFGALAFGVAISGIAVITAYAVSQRTRELGIRLALGSPPDGLARMMVAESLVPASIGAAAGTGAALALGGMLSHLVFGITSHDPSTFVGVVIGLLTATVVASYIPARRASRLDSTVALRSD